MIYTFIVFYELFSIVFLHIFLNVWELSATFLHIQKLLDVIRQDKNKYNRHVQKRGPLGAQAPSQLYFLFVFR